MILKPIKKAQSNTHFGNFSEALLACKVLEAEQLKEVARQAAEAKTPLEQYLVQKDLVDPAAFTLASALAFLLYRIKDADVVAMEQEIAQRKANL